MRTDTIPLSEASEKFGKSENTLKQWFLKRWLTERSDLGVPAKGGGYVSRKELIGRIRNMGNQQGRKMYNTVRTDTFEIEIAYCLARGDYDGAEALRALAGRVGAPILEGIIDQTRLDYEEFLRGGD